LNPPLNLLYHRVNQLEPDPWELCVSPQHFSEHLEVIRQLAQRPCITFDDGYADNLEHALPRLERYDVPAKFFIVSGAIGRRTEMWWDELDLLFPNASDYAREYSRMRTFSPEQQEEYLVVLFRQRDLSRAPRSGRRMLTTEELVRLAASSLVEIGAHTVGHPVLSNFNLAYQRREIYDSKRWLEAALARKLKSFSYPNGMPADYTGQTVQLVKEAGFESAYSAFEHTRPDCFQLPRIMIRDWNGEEFARILASKGAK
jgi:peptidoglycan/xylan/chitin deacetylase (PgdA/CDA1 family)